MFGNNVRHSNIEFLCWEMGDTSNVGTSKCK